MYSTTLSALLGLLALSLASAQTCDPKFQSPGHDFKNGQYSHINATSPGDWYVSTDKTDPSFALPDCILLFAFKTPSPKPAPLPLPLLRSPAPCHSSPAAQSVRPTPTRRLGSVRSGLTMAMAPAGSSPTTKVRKALLFVISPGLFAPRPAHFLSTFLHLVCDATK